MLLLHLFVLVLSFVPLDLLHVFLIVENLSIIQPFIVYVMVV